MNDQLMSKELSMFLSWFANSAPVIGYVPFSGAVSQVGPVTSVLLYRSGQFQIQQFIVPPNTVIPAHTHPNVDSVELYVGGDISFTHSGEWVTFDNKSDEFGLPESRGHTIYVHHDDRHGGYIGEGGGVFISIQQWLNGVSPHCVAADYTGVVMSASHNVVSGEPVLLERPLVREDAL